MPIPILRRRLNGSSSARASVHAPRAHLDPRDIAVLQGVIDAIDAMVVVALPEGTLWKWNQRCDETSGTPLTAVAGQSIWSVVRLRPNIRAAAEDSLERLISGEDRSVEFRAQWLRKDGRKARILWTARLVEIEGFRFVVATGIETTRGLKAARAMAETESRFETLLDLLPDPVVVHQNGHAVFVNRAALEQYGADSAESAMARPVMDWVAPESKEIVGERAGWMLRTGKAAPVEEERHLKFDGTAFDVEVVAAPVIFDGRPAVELVARDITARKAVASALRASEARVRAVFDQSSLGMVVLTRDSVTIESNAALERLLGYDSSELAGMRITDLIHPAEREKSLELVREMFAGRIDGFQSEQRYIAKDGHEIWVRIHAAPVRDGTGVPQLAVGTVEDISGHRTLEDQLRQASKMEALGRLASGVAHDFNNLLTVVNGYADLLAAELEGDERSDEAVAIREAGARGTELTAQLLAFGRRSKRTVEPVDLNGRIEALAPMLRRLVGEDIEFRVDLDNSIGTVEADPSQLDQIVMNLVVNGRDAMPGGGSLLISTYSIDPRSAGRPGAHAWAGMSIADSGVGIEAEVLEHIFEPFFTTKGDGKGTGLGLATVYGIIQTMNGSVRVESTVGEGSRFIVELPLCEADSPREAAAAPSQLPVARAHESILLVEDEPAVRDYCKRALENDGYRVVAGGPRDALGLSAQLGDDLDLLLTDVVMPDFDGPTIAAALTSARRGLRVLFMSGYPRDMKGELTGAVAEAAILAKPFTPGELCDAVRRTLDKPSD